MNRDALLSELRRDEGERLAVYDDEDGKPIVPGKLVRGHPTISIGRALDVNPLTPSESIWLANSTVDAKIAELNRALPWALKLDDDRYRVLLNMAYNLGVPGLLKFENTLRLIQNGKYAAAARAMLQSDWALQVPARAARLAERMKGSERA
jgi:lysozyme